MKKPTHLFASSSDRRERENNRMTRRESKKTQNKTTEKHVQFRALKKWHFLARSFVHNHNNSNNDVNDGYYLFTINIIFCGSFFSSSLFFGECFVRVDFQRHNQKLQRTIRLDHKTNSNLSQTFTAFSRVHGFRVYRENEHISSKHLHQPAVACTICTMHTQHKNTQSKQWRLNKRRFRCCK